MRVSWELVQTSSTPHLYLPAFLWFLMELSYLQFLVQPLPTPASVLGPHCCHLESSVQGTWRILADVINGWLVVGTWFTDFFDFCQDVFLKVWFNCQNLKTRRFIKNLEYPVSLQTSRYGYTGPTFPQGISYWSGLGRACPFQLSSVPTLPFPHLLYWLGVGGTTLCDLENQSKK